jgi:hypothetical protein
LETFLYPANIVVITYFIKKKTVTPCKIIMLFKILIAVHKYKAGALSLLHNLQASARKSYVPDTHRWYEESKAK